MQIKNDPALFDFLADFIENDPSYLIRQHIIQSMCKYPPFKLNSDESCLNTESVVIRLWNLMGDKFCFNNSLKSGIVELYHLLFGMNKPKCLKHTSKQTIISNFEVKLED
ncbi:transcription initiation factor TFIID subunit 2 [Brachionus plicatilis]|uniref:Transcription initiation factor TFIID subunit 2 n=1 Tax=Brachionus plicatilis TaxID=10195 RepID=A0A3M7SC32_BRAPC|nr:transcription initiation factor TFIID subunit 2 [Brachionus plicatilis]